LEFVDLLFGKLFIIFSTIKLLENWSMKWCLVDRCPDYLPYKRAGYADQSGFGRVSQKPTSV